MNLSKPDSKKIKINFFKNLSTSFLYPIILLIALTIFFVVNKQYLFQKFDQSIVNNYLRSQDILDESDGIKDRIFVSDAEIYISAGYLYTSGEDPRSYNFQHPPLIKYLFGLSAKYFDLPLLPNLVFAIILIFGVYLLGKFIFKNETVGFLASLLQFFDPVFKEVTIYALLDLGQIVFLLGFLITTILQRSCKLCLWNRSYIVQGILLGLAMASKFYSPVIIFLGLIYLYKIYTKDLNIKRELLVLLFSFLTFSFTYIVSFKNESGLFSIFFHQAKIIKFMLDHNQAVEWGGVLKMFFGGYFVWPILFFVNLYFLFKTKLKDIKFLFILIPLIYLLVMCFQIPFTRYLILILPFLYLSLATFFMSKVIKLQTPS